MAGAGGAIYEERGRRVALTEDQPAAVFVSVAMREGRFSAPPSDGNARRAVVEIVQQISGHPQRALVGGTFEPLNVPVLTVRVACSQSSSGAAATCPSWLWTPLVAGLPEEYGDSVLVALGASVGLGGGVLSIDRAAYDDVMTSESALKKAADLLVVALTLQPSNVVEAEIRRRIRAW